ncbi:MAG: hypothetical protein OEU90_08665 [Gammaproteobacteria bacterium]|nr:hypothetical protein [Gammaproteobacteria bacterium]MDH3751659.1 hypothetical protein [Gammaproteobacteria bacterium]MDH3805528.1 hypothetical protein [Gammaproteobacteria bacterium]
MRKLLFGMAALVLLAASPASAGKGVTPMLKMNTTYNFVLNDFKPMAQFVERSLELQWALVWEGTIQGDVNGAMRWWIPYQAVPEVFVGVGRWEIWDCEPVYPSLLCKYDDPELLIMAGYESWAYVGDTDYWEGKGVVTYANEQYAEWFGRRITDGGWVDFGGLPFGQGQFTIYNRPSNKH